MADKIGYQDGITAFFDWYRKQPGVPQRGPNYDEGDINTWPWPDKMERTMRMLKDDHDARASGVVPPPNPEPEPEPEPEQPQVAPMAYKRGENNSDPRYCCFNPDGSLRPGLSFVDPPTNQLIVDRRGTTYNRDGMIQSNWHLRNRYVEPPGVLPSNSMDDRSVCQQYTGTNGQQIGGSAGYPRESYE